MKKVLLCPPTAYDIEYEINPWMHIENKVSRSKVYQEFQALREVYTGLGVEMLEITQVAGLPDMVYAANFGYVFGDTFIKANFMYPERQNEAVHAKAFFQHLGYNVKELPATIAWEGQGDLLGIGGRYYLGWGKRSDRESKQYLEAMLGAPLVDFQLINPYYYHLDTCFLPLNTETVAINPESFTPEGLQTIRREFKNVIAVGKEDNDLLACNAVVVGSAIVVGTGISAGLKAQFAEHGFSTKEVPMEEYRKGGGSVKCLTLEL